MLRPGEFSDTRPSLLLLLRGGNGDQLAWRVFFERYAPPVYRIARLRGLNDTDADDVVQEVMLAVSAHIGGFEYDRDRGRFRQWVRQIAEGKIADHFRRSHRTASSRDLVEQPSDGRPTLEELWEKEWLSQDMLHCLEQMAERVSPRRMEAFRLYVLEGLSASEVGRRLGMTEGHVYAVRYHVLGLIRKRMEKLERNH